MPDARAADHPDSAAHAEKEGAAAPASNYSAIGIISSSPSPLPSASAAPTTTTTAAAEGPRADDSTRSSDAKGGGVPTLEDFDKDYCRPQSAPPSQTAERSPEEEFQKETNDTSNAEVEPVGEVIVAPVEDENVNETAIFSFL